MSDHAMVKFNRFTKMIQKIDKYVRKRSFRNFQPDAIRACVAGIPELRAILQCEDVDTATTLLTAGLTTICGQCPRPHSQDSGLGHANKPEQKYCVLLPLHDTEHGEPGAVWLGRDYAGRGPDSLYS